MAVLQRIKGMIGKSIKSPTSVGTLVAGTAAKRIKSIQKTEKTSKLKAFGKTALGIGIGAAALYGVEKVAERVGVRGGAGFIGKRQGTAKRFKRMNPLNIKALKRSTKRLAGFDKVADSVRKELSRIAPRPKQKSSAGSITAVEAIKALRN